MIWPPNSASLKARGSANLNTRGLNEANLIILPPKYANLNTRGSANLNTRGLNEANLMIWPPISADLNPIENLWSIIKQDVYKDGRQFSSKEDLWRAVQEAAEAVPVSTIHRLTSSLDSRLLDVHTKKGKHINK